MLVSTKGRYALRVLIDLAENDNGEFIPLRDIAQRQQISEKYLESIIKILTNNGLLTGLRGKGGGYKLTKSPSSYTVGGILRLTEGTIAPVACLEGDSVKCARSAECRTLPMWRELNHIVSQYLDSVTVASLAKPQETKDNYVI